MPFRDNKTHLADILQGIERIELFVADVDFERYKTDTKTKSAVERQLQIISEAAHRLGDERAAICDDPALRWKQLIGMGDVLRHGYHKIDDDVLWITIQVELPKLKSAVIEALKHL